MSMVFLRASIRARIGYSNERTLLYGTDGVAFAKGELRFRFYQYRTLPYLQWGRILVGH